MGTFHRSITGKQGRIQKAIRYMTFGTFINNLNNFTPIFRTIGNFWNLLPHICQKDSKRLLIFLHV